MVNRIILLGDLFNHMDCSIVIRAYNEERHLPRLLQGIQSQTVKDVEVILVDSGSTDSTISIATASGAHIVHIEPSEFTFGRSLNRGISKATHPLVVIASAHVYPVYPDWLESLLRPLNDERIGLTYGKQRGPETAKFSEQQIFQQWYPDLSVKFQPTSFCNNANAAVRRSLWEEHPYDETLTGLEDLAWAEWARHHGHEISYVAEAEIIHLHDETPRVILNRYRREAMAFKRIYPEAHFNLYDFVRLASSNILSDVRNAARSRVLWKSLASILWFRTMQFYGTRLGYRDSDALTPQLRQTFYYARGIETPDLRSRDIEPIQYEE